LKVSAFEVHDLVGHTIGICDRAPVPLVAGQGCWCSSWSRQFTVGSVGRTSRKRQRRARCAQGAEKGASSYVSHLTSLLQLGFPFG
jgi:hypothetical protein